jgi:hypothetical protein
MKDAIKHGKTLYTLGDHDAFSNKAGENKVFETNEPITKFTNELTTKIQETKSNSPILNSTRTAQIYFTHKLVQVKNS